MTSETPNAANEVADQGEETPPGKGVPPLPVAAGERSCVPFQFSGSGSEYFRIWIVNVVLSIVTLGIYSAWAKVRKKQYFYGSTRIQEAGFEYLADPTKILKGRLIVVSLFILYSVLSGLAPIIGTILSLAFVAGLPWLVVRSLAFNAHNSAVRNIRFGFQGKVSEAAKVYVLWPLAATLTLGLPVMLTELAYSREFEREADHYALAYLRSHDIPPRHFAALMERIDAEMTKIWHTTGGKWPSYLSTHPMTEERIKEFE